MISCAFVCFLFEFLGFCFLFDGCVRFDVQCAQCGKIGETNALDLLPNELFVTLHICVCVCLFALPNIPFVAHIRTHTK